MLHVGFRAQNVHGVTALLSFNTSFPGFKVLGSGFRAEGFEFRVLFDHVGNPEPCFGAIVLVLSRRHENKSPASSLS